MISDGTAVKQATSAARHRRYRAPVDLVSTLKFPLQRPPHPVDSQLAVNKSHSVAVRRSKFLTA